MSAAPTIIDDPAVNAFGGALGTYRLLGDHSWTHGESRVWVVQAGAGQYFVKQHARRRKFEQELYAYLHWAAALSGAVPELVAHSDVQLGVLILAAWAGQPLGALSLDAAQERAVHQAAGAQLRRLHIWPLAETPSVYIGLRQKLDKWTALALGLVEAPITEFVRRECEALLATPGLRAVPCHNDYSPRNWLVNGDGSGLGIIDFEHAGPGLWLQDFSRLWSQLWPLRPDLEAAFFSGYGTPLSDPDRRMLSSLSALDALATVVWAARHGDDAFEARGRSVLARLVASS